jgi:hypothetical protein
MLWHDAAAYFFGGAFLANSVPHLVTGVSGQRFPTPFAKPPARGLSPPPVNVLWGLFNLAVSYSLLMLVGSFELHRLADAAVAGAGFGLAAVGVARSAGKLRLGSRDAPKA